jgi:ligand-binding sensor domain-containing protein
MYAIVADPAKPGQLYLGTEQGVWVSRDYGQTWQALDETPDGRVTRLAIVPGAETWLYLWTGARFIPVSLPSPAP